MSGALASTVGRSAPAVHFVAGAEVADAHRDRMAELLFATSYLEYCSVGNKLQLPLPQLQRVQNIEPYIDHVYGMYDDERNFTGFFTAATVEEFGRIPAASYYRDEVRAMDDAYDAFVREHARAGDLFVASLAVEARYRGQGLLTPLLGEIERLARSKNSGRIVLTVWERSDALRLYLKKGFKICGSFGYAYELFFERLHFLEYDAVAKAATLPGD